MKTDCKGHLPSLDEAIALAEREKNMTDPYRILRRFQDQRLGLDVPTLTETELHVRLVTEATIDAILAEHGLAHPLTVCRDCEHYNEDTGRCISEEGCRHV